MLGHDSMKSGISVNVMLGTFQVLVLLWSFSRVAAT